MSPAVQSTTATAEKPARRRRQPKPEFPPKLTRRMLGPFLRAHGYPVGDSTIKKLCSPKVGKGLHRTDDRRHKQGEP